MILWSSFENRAPELQKTRGQLQTELEWILSAAILVRVGEKFNVKLVTVCEFCPVKSFVA